MKLKLKLKLKKIFYKKPPLRRKKKVFLKTNFFWDNW